MFIRSLNRAPRAVKLVTVGAITVTAQAHNWRKRHDQPAKEWGLLIGHHRGLSHGNGHNHSRYAVRQASYDLASCGANGSSTNPAEPATNTSRPLAARTMARRGVFASKTAWPCSSFCVFLALR